MSKGRQASVAVQRRVQELAWSGYSPSAIHRELFPAGLGSPDFVTLKTIQRMVRDVTVIDSSGPWSLLDPNGPEDARLILDLVDMWIGRRSDWPSKNLVGYIVRVRSVAPDVPGRWAHSLGRSYQLLASREKPDTRLLDFTLGAAPWKSDWDAWRWAETIRKSAAELGPYDAAALHALTYVSEMDLWSDDAGSAPTYIPKPPDRHEPS